MKLDRNTNRGGRGKYALVNMRMMVPLLDRGEDHSPENNDIQHLKDQMAIHAFNLLVERGIITLGNESPGDQFFVMKYKDKFAAAGLRAYGEAVWKEYSDLMHSTEMVERMLIVADGGKLTPEQVEAGNQHILAIRSMRHFAAEMLEQAREAEKLGVRIPD